MLGPWRTSAMENLIMRWTAKIVCTAASLVLLAIASAQAQEIKKYITPDGKIIYSDEPIPGAREGGSVAAPPPVDPEARERAQEEARENARRAEESSQRAEEASAGQADLASAEVRLQKAVEALEAGKEPLPGERRGTAGGASRLTDAYFNRQRANEQAVRDAQQELDAARARR